MCCVLESKLSICAYLTLPLALQIVPSLQKPALARRSARGRSHRREHRFEPYRSRIRSSDRDRDNITQALAFLSNVPARTPEPAAPYPPLSPAFVPGSIAVDLASSQDADERNHREEARKVLYKGHLGRDVVIESEERNRQKRESLVDQKRKNRDNQSVDFMIDEAEKSMKETITEGEKLTKATNDEESL